MAVRLNLKQNISLYENTKTTLRQNTHSEMETHDYEEIPDENERRKIDPHEYLTLDDRIQKTTNAQNDQTFEPIISTLQDPKIHNKRETVKWKVATLISILLCVGLTSGLVAVLVVWLSARVSPCSEGRCLYSGTCNVVEDKAVCTCVKGFNGTRCEMTPCIDSPCQNEGKCFIHQLQSRCVCKNGFTGIKCEASPCSEGRCLNSGTCVVVNNEAVCTCVKGFNGTRCETSPCSTSSCMNEGTCFIHQQLPRCACRTGFIGANCEIFPCSEGKCLYSGTCNVVEDKAVCTCVKGFNGTRCETTPCSTSSCKNEGTCFIHQLLPRCACRTGFIGANCEIKFPTQDCSDLNSKEHKSGVYVIQPNGSEMFSVYCNMDTDGGGWTVFQKRFNGETDFFREWNDYKEGFGYPKEEYWLGNLKLSLMTSQREYELRIDLEDFQGITAYAKYSPFSIGDESNNYKLVIGGYSGTAGDSLRYHNNMAFSTRDRDNDRDSGNCADSFKTAWWSNRCFLSNLNGRYKGNQIDVTGICWWHWKQNWQSMKKTSMMIRKTEHD